MPSQTGLLPLCTSSATLGLALLQFPLFASFLDSPTSTKTPPTPALKTTFDKSVSRDSISGRPLSLYWKTFFPPGASLIATSALTSFISGIYTYRSFTNSTTASSSGPTVSKLYLYGALAAGGHFLFVPLVAGKIRKMIENAKGLGTKENYEDEGDQRGQSQDEEAEEDVIKRSNERLMRSWLVVHTLRTVTVDLAAVVFFWKAVSGVLGRV
ncbi:MAG: hypothetical protein M1820_010357 [Bogoriella megaspora]|nr:MAG: hypothetical protein M1820_010357 [Bogoriella megaspora]